MSILTSYALLLPLGLTPVQDERSLNAVAGRLVEAGYRQDTRAIRAALDDLDGVDAPAAVHAYWHGYGHWRLAEQLDHGAGGLGVEPVLDQALAALQRAITEDAEHAEAYALLSVLYNWKMEFHHDEKGRWAQAVGQCIDRAEALAPDNPRVMLAHASDLMFTPTQYGGDPAAAFALLERAVSTLESEAESSAPPAIGRPWGMVDAELLRGEGRMQEGDAGAALAAFERALELAPGCVVARDSGIPRARRLASTRLGPELAEPPLPVPSLEVAAGMDSHWPCWRGPRRDGVSPAELTVDGEELWRLEVGLGYSGLAVAEGRLLTKGFDTERSVDVVRALDARTGEELWRHEYPAKIWDHMHAGGSLSMPVVDGDRVYVLDRDGGIRCLRSHDGELVWSRALVDEEALQLPTWGLAASPVVLGDQLILNVGRVLSLDKHSGERQWRSAFYGDSYSTPTPLATAEDSPALAAFTARGLAVLDLRSGRELGFQDWVTTYDQNCASPVLLGSDRLFISSGMNRGGSLLRFGSQGLEPVWESRRAMRTTMAACVADGEVLYGFDNRVLKCIEADRGEVLWQKRGYGWGALAKVGDLLVTLTEDGELVWVLADPSGYEELGRERVFSAGHCWTPPVAVDGMLYLRNSLGTLVCRAHGG